MQEYSETFEKWRRLIVRTNLYFVLFIFLVEFFLYFVLKYCNLIIQPIPIYLIAFLFTPTITNILIIIIGNTVLNHFSINYKYINYIPVIQMASIGLVAASTHFVFPITLAFFCFPVFTTVIFGDSRMTTNVEIICSIFLTFSLISRKFSPFKMEIDDKFLPEAIIAFAILIASGIICSLLIKYQNEKSDIIYKGYLHQLDLQDQINKDQNTGLYGHEMLMKTLYRMVKSAETTKDELVLAIIDIDDFKKVNDTHGHLWGDKVILKLASLMQQHNHDNYFLSRFGGEEFAIIFKGVDMVYAFEFLEKIRLEFEKQTLCLSNYAITLSTGIASWKPGLDSNGLFNNADKAMYTAKKNGKNRTIKFE